MSFIAAVLLLNIFGCRYKGCRLSPLCCYSISLVVGTRDVVYRRCVATQYLWLYVQGMSFIAAVLLLNIFGCRYKGCRLSPLCCYSISLVVCTRDVVYRCCVATQYLWLYVVVYRCCVATQYLWLYVQGMSFIAAVLLLNIFGCMYKGCRLSLLCCYSISLVVGTRDVVYRCCVATQSLVVGTRDVVYRRCAATQYLWL